MQCGRLSLLPQRGGVGVPPLYNPDLMDSNTLPVITTTRVVLRWISEDDIDGLYEVFSDPQVMRYWSSGPLANRDAAAAMQREIAAGNENNTMFKWGLALRESNLVIGTTTLFNLNLDNGRAEIGYAMGRAYWGKGYMNEALRRWCHMRLK